MKKRLVILLAIGLLAISTVPLFAQGVMPAWQQSFEQDKAGWIGSETPGAVGWCGTTTRHERGSGPVAPSKGHGYATVEHGECNDFWDSIFPNGSAPYSPLGGYSASWPQSGFVTELDIYLDPTEPTTFTYANSIRFLPLVGSEQPPFRYFAVDVMEDGDKLLVNGHQVAEAGWYTFRFEFSEEDEGLAVDFELADKGRVLFSEPIATTLSGEATSSFTADNVGTGYAWFVQISEGLQLPIDHAKYRPGK